MLPKAIQAVKPRIIAAIKERFLLDWHGYHGPSHWGRVCWHAQDLARKERVNPLVPTLFAWLHDSCRENEYDDEAHGERAAHFAVELHEKGLLPIHTDELDDLYLACVEHSNGSLKGPRVVQVCWDADRLDLWRVGITPHPERLCTESAKHQEKILQARTWALKASLIRINETPDKRRARPHR